MRFLKWASNNILFIFTIFLLAFIPLYPKIPLLDIQHTWVYIRLEDFAVALTIVVWIIFLLQKKVTLKTPLTIPIMVYWIIGGIATLHGVLLLFPSLSGLFSNVAFLSYLRRIEYMSLFFISFASIRNKKDIVYAAVSLTIILLAIIAYGFGQKFLGFPAFLTMNEEFAKGIPIQLSALSRVPSTFAGQYDLAAYLVLVIPILASLIFGFKNIIVKFCLLIISILGFVLLFMTVSRISFFALLISLVALLVLQKKKIIIAFLLALTFILLLFSPSLYQRFQSTVSEVDVLVNARTGAAVGQVKEVPSEFFKDKTVRKLTISNANGVIATTSAVLPYEYIPPVASLVIEANNASTGENLPQGTSYVNLPLSPISKKVNQYFFQKLVVENGIQSEEITVFYGDFLIKRAKAYDLSFTTRFQGEWPGTFDAFKRNIFLGSGYGSVSLAVDNDYLRILGESGLFGFFSFVLIFIAIAIYIKKLLPKVDSPVAKSFILGFAAGSLGLAINASLIDVFEASKVAFTYWILAGITIGTLILYKKEDVNILKELKKIITSPVSIIGYIFVVVASLFFSLYSNYFTGDDFTWLRWASQGGNVLDYFTKASGFFYRPGTKLYFYLMHSSFWLNQTMYHFVSILTHFVIAVLLLLIFRKILKNYLLSIISVFIFIILSVHHEDIFWISSTGLLFNALFALTGLLSFIYYKEKRKVIYFIFSLASIVFSLLFHELGIIVPLLIISYDLIFNEKISLGNLIKKPSYWILLSPIIPYLGMRLLAQSHWFGGDYNYNLIKLPYNVLGNTIGYLMIDFFGPQILPLYEMLRNFSKEHIAVSGLFLIIAIFVLVRIYKIIFNKIEKKEQKLFIFGSLFFFITLLPFLGLGNIAARYSYLSSVGFVIILVLLFKKAYLYLVDISDRYIGTFIIVIAATIYIMVQLFALQKIHNDWKVAGDKTQRFLISIEQHSDDTWLRNNMRFYFVNKPVKNGEAWVWPVGLEDALWFTFKNPNLSVYMETDIDSAIDQAEGVSGGHAFIFDEEGNVTEVIRTREGKKVYLN